MTIGRILFSILSEAEEIVIRSKGRQAVDEEGGGRESILQYLLS
jgi:hypothetical protein